MRVTELLVRRMKSQFADHRDLHRAAKYAGLPLTLAQAKSMWGGRFTGIPFEAVESFMLALGYELEPKKIDLDS